MQNNEHVRALVRLVAFNGGQIGEPDLRSAFNRYIDIAGVTSSSHVEKDFNTIAKLATRSFLKRALLDREAVFSLFNPSIADFIFSEYRVEDRVISAVFQSLDSAKSLDQLSALSLEKVAPSDNVIALERGLLRHALDAGKNVDYLIALVWLLQDDAPSLSTVVCALDQVIAARVSLSSIWKFFELATRFAVWLRFGDFEFLPHLFGQKILDEDEIRAFAAFMDAFKVDSDQGMEAFQYEFENFLLLKLNQRADEVELSEFVEIGGDGYELDVTVDREGIRSELAPILDDIVASFSYEVVKKISLSLGDIVREVDTQEMADQYVRSQSEESDHDGYRGGATYLDQSIDDLFQRT